MRHEQNRRPGKGRKAPKSRHRKEDKKWRNQKATEEAADMNELLAEIGIAICPRCTAQYMISKDGCPHCS